MLAGKKLWFSSGLYSAGHPENILNATITSPAPDLTVNQNIS